MDPAGCSVAALDLTAYLRFRLQRERGERGFERSTMEQNWGRAGMGRSRTGEEEAVCLSCSVRGLEALSRGHLGCLGTTFFFFFCLEYEYRRLEESMRSTKVNNLWGY